MSTAVNAGDIDLSTPAGARKMLARIRRASQKVCLADEGGYIFLGQGIARCEEETTAGAVAKLNAPVVTAVYQGHAVTTLARR